jgi:hypothetical protein
MVSAYIGDAGGLTYEFVRASIGLGADYSDRSASTGSTRVTRRAGR